MNIIELAKQAEFSDREIQISHDNFARFAALVAAHEREECAKISDDVDGYDRFVNQFISKRIRERGTT
jgi:siroheme synthase (precorrin-2 oxidase/ferrochelatase)